MMALPTKAQYGASTRSLTGAAQLLLSQLCVCFQSEELHIDG